LTIAIDQRGTELGQGLYGLGDLRAYLSLSGEEADGAYALDWLTDILNPVGHQRRRPDYSFGDLISLFVVRELKRKGVRTRDIRDAEVWLREKWQTDRPFLSGEIKTDGRGIFVDDDLIAGQIEAAERHGQQVMREAIKERLTSVHYDDGTAAYWTPMEFVLVDPRVQFGEPVVAGTRVPTATVSDMATYAAPADIAADLGISAEKARAALTFERRLNALRN
jgi:uncharacterized protein (DUF433 family)